jgi:hypothetical protein
MSGTSLFSVLDSPLGESRVLEQRERERDTAMEKGNPDNTGPTVSAPIYRTLLRTSFKLGGI